MRARSPGVSELTLPFAGNPKHLSAKMNDQLQLTFFQMTTQVPPKLYTPETVGRNPGGPISVATTIPPLFPGTMAPVRPSAPITYGRYNPNTRKWQAPDKRDSHQGTSARAAPRATKDQLSLLRASFTDASMPVYTSAGTTLPTYCTLGPHSPPLINAQELAALPLDLSTSARVVTSSSSHVQLQVPRSLMTQEINQILTRVQAEITTTATSMDI